MEVGCEAAETLYPFCVAVCGHGYVMFCTSHVDPRCIHIQWRKDAGRPVLGNLAGPASLTTGRQTPTVLISEQRKNDFTPRFSQGSFGSDCRRRGNLSMARMGRGRQ